jgi:acetyl-CoA acetyltransferase
VNREIVNRQGDALAIGHRLGAFGAGFLAPPCMAFSNWGARGVAAICIGQGLAVVLENTTA